MAPEQIMGRGGDARSDVYSLGVVLYRMLSGLAPFRAISVPAVIHAHLNTQPMPVVEVAPGVPGSLDIVVQRCLAKRPDDRYPTMAVLSDVLRAAMAPLDEERASVPFPASDPYTDERTDVTRPCIAAIVPMRERTSSDSFEEATARMDRAHFGRYGAGVSDEVTHTDQLLPRACAMCRTVNPAHARACSACGVSLEADEQDAVRVRVVPASPASAASSSALEAGWRAPAPMLPRRSLWERLLTWLGFRRR
jgi:serine/threonine-protein kinase